jgi:ubiquitin-protein ligase
MATHSLAAAKRLRKELQVLRQAKEADPDISLHLQSPDNLLVWQAWIRGPVETPYEGGVFQLDIRCGVDYPLAPPSIRFVTKVRGSVCVVCVPLECKWSIERNTGDNREYFITAYVFAVYPVFLHDSIFHHYYSYHSIAQVFHPNVHFRTGDICLDILKKEWSPAWGLQAACRAVLALLSDPDAESPLNCDAGNMVRAGDAALYEATAALYTIENACFTAWPPEVSLLEQSE